MSCSDKSSDGKDFMKSKLIFLTIIFSFSISFNGCEPAPAPLDEETFTEIMKTTMKITTRNNYSLPLQGTQLLEVYIQSFDECGYSYSATIKNVVEEGFSFQEASYATLLILPIDNLSDAEIKYCLSDDELKNIKQLKRMIRDYLKR
jgi:hypothetical protein